MLLRRCATPLSILLLVGCGGETEITNPQPQPPAIRPPSPLLVERDALAAFYHATGGDSWKQRDNWLTSAPVEDWYGVAVHAGSSGRVYSIDLRDNGLSGSIPPEIENLENMVFLALGGNLLTGAIPPELGKLSRLERLRLAHNELTGCIPPEIGNLDGLKSLELMDNLLTGVIPPELASISRLERLWLYGNELTGSIPPEIGNLVSLAEMDLSRNDLAGAIPQSIGSAKRLRTLRVAGLQRITDLRA